MNNKNTFSEETELKELAQGSPEALKAIYKRYSPSVFRIASRYLKETDLAKDLVQEVFTKVWEKRVDFSGVNNFNAYLVTVSKNLALKYLKEIAREERVRDEWGVLHKQDLDHNNSLSEDQRKLYEEVKQAVSLLPKQRQKVYQMAKFEGLSYRAISEHLGISQNTVRNHMVSANRFIRNHVSETSILISFGILIFMSLL